MFDGWLEFHVGGMIRDPTPEQPPVCDEEYRVRHR